MKDILDIDMGFEDEQLTLYLENIKGKNEDDFKLATASRVYSGQGRNESDSKDPLSSNHNRGQTAVPSLRTSPIKGATMKQFNVDCGGGF